MDGVRTSWAFVPPRVARAAPHVDARDQTLRESSFAHRSPCSSSLCVFHARDDAAGGD